VPQLPPSVPAWPGYRENYYYYYYYYYFMFIDLPDIIQKMTIMFMFLFVDTLPMCAYVHYLSGRQIVPVQLQWFINCQYQSKS